MAKKPATKKPASTEKPAVEQPAAAPTYGVKALAEKLGRDPKAVRAAMRRIDRQGMVGQGGRYSFTQDEFDAWFDRLSKRETRETEAASA